ncbi:MAG TPA: PIN domain-containing protein [Thermoanaerobaculia bacterium]
MAQPKIRAFLDTNVLLEYLRGKPELQGLFTPEVEARVSFAVNPVVLQEFMLASGRVQPDVDLATIASHLEVLAAEAFTPSERLQRLRPVRNFVAHANDLMILASSRHCDVLLTYDVKLRELGESAEIEAETPEEFLEDLQLAS